MATTTRTRKKDPFATEPEVSDTNKEISVDVTPVENQDTGEIEWSATFKGGTGFDSAWLVGRFNNLEAVNAQVTGERAELLKDTMTKVSRAGVFFASQAPSGAAAPAASGRSEAPNGQTRQCKHGNMQFRSGVKNGKTWEGYFCPTPKGTPDQCKPEFSNN